MRCEYDLHVHSTFSDGTLHPRTIIALAAEQGLTGIALTDHDTLDGLQEAIDYIASSTAKIDFVPGIELNTEPEKEGSEIHILGYYIEPDDVVFKIRLREIRDLRRNRAVRMVDKLNQLGFPLSFERVESLAGSDLIGRPHVALAMVKGGWAESMEQVFDQYIGYGRPAYVRRYKFPPREAIELIKASGGIAVLAHPGLIADQSLIDPLLKAGIEGLEVYYPRHTREQTAVYLKLARKNHLLVTGGSDFHGPGSSESRARLGAAGIDREQFVHLKTHKDKAT